MYVPNQNTFAIMKFPSPTSYSWIPRFDSGSYKTLRWSFFDGNVEKLQLVVLHSACDSARGFYPSCNHCQHPEWHLKCSTPQNLFYLFLCTDENEAGDRYCGEVVKFVELDDEVLKIYSSSVPSLVVNMVKDMVNGVRKYPSAQFLKNVSTLRKEIRMSTLYKKELTYSVPTLNSNDEDDDLFGDALDLCAPCTDLSGSKQRNFTV